MFWLILFQTTKHSSYLVVAYSVSSRKIGLSQTNCLYLSSERKINFMSKFIGKVVSIKLIISKCLVTARASRWAKRWPIWRIGVLLRHCQNMLVYSGAAGSDADAFLLADKIFYRPNVEPQLLAMLHCDLRGSFCSIRQGRGSSFVMASDTVFTGRLLESSHLRDVDHQAQGLHCDLCCCCFCASLLWLSVV